MGLFVPLLLLFAGSGCAALIYEIVWFQLLQLAIGSTAVSLGILLAAYMGGLCLGSLLLPRVVSPRIHPLRIYALLELGIGLLGVLALFVTPALGHVWFPRILAALSLLPPTILMGASLPALSRLCKTPAALGYLYAANIAGAVFGALFAGFYLLRVYDMAVATFTAAAINLTIAFAGIFLSKVSVFSKTSVPSSLSPCPRVSVVSIYAAIALSGLSALGAEVVWTRLLSLLLGATTYTFSLIVAVFLIGLWLGSTAGSALAKRTKIRILLSPLARSYSPSGSPGPLTPLLIPSPSGQSIPGSPPTPGSTSNSTSSAACGQSSRQPSSGAQVSP